MSIRLRLGLWYSGVAAGTVIVFSLLVYSVIAQHQIAEEHEEIMSRAHHLQAATQANAHPPLNSHDPVLAAINAFAAPDVYVQVVDTEGEIIVRSDNLGDQMLVAEVRDLEPARSGDAVFFTSRVGEDSVRVAVRPLLLDGQVAGFIEVGTAFRESSHTLAELRLIFASAGLLLSVAAGIIGWTIAGGTLKPIELITRTAEAIAQSLGLSGHMEGADSHDELGRLAATINRMLSSLKDAHAAQQCFIEDAAHELRTPLTAIHTNLDLLASHGDKLPAEERGEVVRACCDEADRMARLIDRLLSLAKADAGRVNFRLTELDRLVLEVYEEARLLAKGRKIGLRQIDRISLMAEPDLLRQLLLILVDNAIRYTPHGRTITLSLSQDSTWAMLQVDDAGIGIPPEDLPHIFRRFYRGRQTRAVPGTGLGLAIAKSIVEQHGGHITVESTPGRGSTFTAYLPLPQ